QQARGDALAGADRLRAAAQGHGVLDRGLDQLRPGGPRERAEVAGAVGQRLAHDRQARPALARELEVAVAALRVATTAVVAGPVLLDQAHLADAGLQVARARDVVD